MDYPKSVPSVGLVNGKFVDENPITGQVGSLISSEWGNAVTDELLNVIRAGGDEPVEAEHDQLLAAIKAIVKDSIPPEKIRTTLAAYGITDAYTKSVTYTKAEIEALLKNMSALPVGAMVPFPKGTVPAGFLEVDGSVQSIAALPDLAAYLGTAFNKGDEGGGNFRLPDSRGEFVRGWDHGRGVDLGRAIGSWQADEVKSHTHSISNQSTYGSGSSSGPQHQSAKVGDLATPTNPSGGNETRPRNLAVMWCIKAWNAPINQGQVDVAALVLEMQKLRALSGFGGHKGLVVSATGTNAIISVKATGLIVGSGATAQALNGVDVNINLQTPGLNGLDVGSLAASSWYSSWVVTNGAQVAGIAALMPVIQGTTTAGSSVVTGIASTSSMRPGMRFGGTSFPSGAFIKTVDSEGQITVSVVANATAANSVLRFVYDPVLPAGFVAVRVGAFLTDSTANRYPLRFFQNGKTAEYAKLSATNVAEFPIAASGGTGWVMTAISLAAFVPPTATTVKVVAALTTSEAYSDISVAPVVGYANNDYSGINGPSLFGYLSGGFQANVMLQNMGMAWNSRAANGKIIILGWEDSL
ncbi:tail fiber protein [Pseudomonas sp. TH05]|uniref:phage tail protein n=1 Tax=unclassified Pseudomonas TaxID=196821 RepID=UPI001912D85C|nr:MULTISPECIES: tail fiber protein [unclassified Pseudomonas]MBK5539402.1 tail fiber protein [Pseudomonas sp. TH07]MBK5557522.1 tail fiber protein [Pseudomonas sp. TH05]